MAEFRQLAEELEPWKFAKPYPYWHKICVQIHTLSGTNPQKSVPAWAQLVYKNGTLAQLLVRSAENVANLVHFFYILHSSWHNQCKNHALSDTHLMFKTLPLVAHCLKTLPFVALKLDKMVPLPS